MDRYMITHSLLSSWLYTMNDSFDSDRDLFEEFKQVLNRVQTPTTDAMQNGIDFENLVTAIVTGSGDLTRQKTYNYSTKQYDIKMLPAEDHVWYPAAKATADIVKDGQLQCVASKEIELCGINLLLYGRLDALKAGVIYDIKFSASSYDKGKYFSSTQHPMYLELIPEAGEFSYLISNGSSLWTETYRRDESPDIRDYIRDFISWLKAHDLYETYKERWRTQ